jgi:hypothetical protein
MTEEEEELPAWVKAASAGYAEACKPELARLLTPYFENPPVGTFGGPPGFVRLLEPEYRARVEAEKQEMVDALATQFGVLYEWLSEIPVDPAELLAAVAKKARWYRRPGRPPGMRRRPDDDQILAEIAKGTTPYQIAKQLSGGDIYGKEHDRIEKRAARLRAQKQN